MTGGEEAERGSQRASLRGHQGGQWEITTRNLHTDW